MNKRILALDLGTTTGWSYQDRDGTITVGSFKWNITDTDRAERMDRRADPRILQFFEWLRKFIGLVDIVVFEDVQFSSYTLQVQLWSSLRACVWLAFGGREVFIDAVPVGTLKKFATGSGAAEKQDMARSLVRRFPERFTWQTKKTKRVCKQVRLIDKTTNTVIDDNAVDAILLLLWAKTIVKI